MSKLHWVFELSTEEIPHMMLPSLHQSLGNLTQHTGIPALLAQYGISCEAFHPYSTPRRLAFLAHIASHTQPQQTEVRGPTIAVAYTAHNTPSTALQAFMRSHNVQQEDLYHKDSKGKTYIYTQIRQNARPIQDVIPDILTEFFGALPLGKSMAWGDALGIRFVRPIRSFLCMLDQECMPLYLSARKGQIMFTIQSEHALLSNSAILHGHRNQTSAPQALSHAKDYVRALSDLQVMVDREARLASIQSQITDASDQMAAKPLLDNGLLDKLCDITENPHVALASFNPTFLDLPDEVLTSEMIEHQLFVPLISQAKQLLPYFCIVANTPIQSTIIEGNQQVLSARLSDAHFFLQEDSKQAFSTYASQLPEILFAKNAGSMWDKVLRLEHLGLFTIEQLGLTCSPDLLLQAIRLCKNDLPTKMVCEFPHLQGIMGSYYAQPEANADICEAIRSHYAPRFSKDSVPHTELGSVLALIDKLDSIYTLFVHGYTVTGSKDPYAMRRHTLGAIRILVENQYHMALEDSFTGLYPEADPAIWEKLRAFIWERLRHYLADQGLDYDIVQALSASSLALNPFDLYKKAYALQNLRTRTPEYVEVLVHTSKRIQKILPRPRPLPVLPETTAEMEASEQLLLGHIQGEHAMLHLSMLKAHYQKTLETLVPLAVSTQHFLDQTLILSPDIPIRERRLGLLSYMLHLLESVAPFDRLAIQEKSHDIT